MRVHCSRLPSDELRHFRVPQGNLFSVKVRVIWADHSLLGLGREAPGIKFWRLRRSQNPDRDVYLLNPRLHRSDIPE